MCIRQLHSVNLPLAHTLDSKSLYKGGNSHVQGRGEVELYSGPYRPLLDTEEITL